MENLITFKAGDLAKITDHRSGEIKFGEKMLTVPKDVSPQDFLNSCEAKYVLLGIPEDIGVRANSGRAGAASAWQTAIASIANIQVNKFNKAAKILVLGQVDVKSQMDRSANLDINKIEDKIEFNNLVSEVDKEVVHIIMNIVKAGKIPIIIGGGHNNSYGNIKGTALAKGKAINAINFDAHSDFRILEGRHSGNGFSYAFEDGFLKKYFIFGLHENYTSKNVLDTIKKLEARVRYNTYDEIAIRRGKSFDDEMVDAYDFINSDHYGIEIDLDAVPGIASSAMTISGFSVEEVRRFVTYFGKNHLASYLHICEGAPDLADPKNKHLIGKLIGYLVTDFIRSHSRNDEK